MKKAKGHCGVQRLQVTNFQMEFIFRVRDFHMESQLKTIYLPTRPIQNARLFSIVLTMMET